MKKLDVDKLIKNLLDNENHNEYHIMGDDCSNEIDEEQFKHHLLQLVLEMIGDRKSVEELEPVMNDAINDFANKVCFKEGYNQAIKYISQRARELFGEEKG